jgi:DNA mismatch repair ATPase MutS
MLLIDRTTLADLQIFESPGGRGGVFDVIARTQTSLGRAALRRRITSPSSDLAEIRDIQSAVKHLQRVADCVRLDDTMVSAVSRYLRSNITVTSSPPWLQAVESAWLKLRYHDLFSEISEGVNVATSLFTSLAVLCADLRASDPPHGIGELLDGIEEGVNLLFEARSQARTVPELDRVIRSGLNHTLDDALMQLGELDALTAMALTTSELAWTWPELVERDTFVLEADGVRHPFLKDSVPNPVRLNGGEPMVFLTGPNMAGKTTYLRAVGVIVLLAQAGMGVPAAHARLTPVEALFSSLNPADDLRAGLSYFMAEVLRVREAATILAGGKRALVLFDEVFKGTNVRDALDASAEVILGFARTNRSGFIFSSHLVELVEVLRVNPSIRFCCFDGDIERGAARYTFALRDGVSDKRFGLHLLHQAQVPQLIAQISA